MNTVLNGHYSPETAFVVEDWPYGYELRCKKRFWIETRPGFGQRLMAQTTNPKKEGDVWNKAKASGYSPIVVLYRDDTSGHVHSDALNLFSTPIQVESFLGKYPEACNDNYRSKMLKGIERLRRQMKGR